MVGVAVAATGVLVAATVLVEVLVRVLVGGTGVLVEVLVEGTAVLVGEAVTHAPLVTSTV
jgi:hypothetical protein